VPVTTKIKNPMDNIFENSSYTLGYSQLMGNINNLYNINNPNRLCYTYVISLKTENMPDIPYGKREHPAIRCV